MIVFYTLAVIVILSIEEQSSAYAGSCFPAAVHNTGGTCLSGQELDDLQQEISRNVSFIMSGGFSCGGTSGWRRVGHLDLTDTSQSCPSVLLESSAGGVRACGRPTETPDCQSVFYTTDGSCLYSKVCGRIRGYQFGATSAFQFASQGLEGNYVEGVSLTHGPSGNRTHIWTFASSLTEVFDGRFSDQFCQCVTSAAPAPPSFVGNDYFCESGAHTVFNSISFYPNDPLWDGQNCVSSCCGLNNPPFFSKTLPAPTTDDIELRLCYLDGIQQTDTRIDQVELYVQ